MLFGGAGGGGGRQQATWSTGGWPGSQPPRRPARGQDHEAQIRLTLEEAARGGSREIQMPDPETGQTRKLRVKIPAGVRPGQRIRLADQGGPAPPGGKRGSLYLKIELLPHPRYRLEGSDLMTTLPLSPWEAALGGKVSRPHARGRAHGAHPAGLVVGAQDPPARARASRLRAAPRATCSPSSRSSCPRRSPSANDNSMASWPRCRRSRPAPPSEMNRNAD